MQGTADGWCEGTGELTALVGIAPSPATEMTGAPYLEKKESKNEMREGGRGKKGGGEEWREEGRNGGRRAEWREEGGMEGGGEEWREEGGMEGGGAEWREEGRNETSGEE